MVPNRVPSKKHLSDQIRQRGHTLSQQAIV